MCDTHRRQRGVRRLCVSLSSLWWWCEMDVRSARPRDCTPVRAALRDLLAHFVHRGDFIDALLGVLPEGMVKLGHRLTGIVDNGTTATATFDNGVSVTADLIVGADGIRSQVRAHLYLDIGGLRMQARSGVGHC